MFEFCWKSVSLLVITGLLIHKLLQKNASYFEKRNVKTPKSFPVLGFMYEVIVRRRHITEVFREYYKEFSDTRFIGIFEFLTPVYFIRDLDLIRQISIKNFDSFLNHRSVITENADNLFGKNLFILRDEKWRSMRSTLSPAFTGSKMRHMFSLVADIANDYMKELRRMFKTERDIEFKEFANKYCHDVIAKCSFGVTINSLANPENKFFKAGLHVTRFPLSMQLKFMGYSAFPRLMNFLKVKVFDSQTKKFFTELVSSNIKYREENNIRINDVINLLMQARRDGSIEMENDKAYESAGFATVMESDEIKASSGQVAKWDLEDITAQCMVFFLAGFDTVATAMYFMAHSLAVNPKVQQKLLEEVDSLTERLNGQLPSYEDIQSLNYLDMVLTETLRLFPPVPFLDRQCNEKTIIENSDGTKVELQPGDGVYFPVSCIHNDPSFFPEPEKFLPERFSHDNRDNIKPFSYLPFGVGPRNCIGSRFALLETKALFVALLSNFTLETSSRTENPLRLKPDAIANRPANGVWVSLKPRKNHKAE